MSKLYTAAALACCLAVAGVCIPAGSMSVENAQAANAKNCVQSGCHSSTPSASKTQPTSQTITVSMTSASYKVSAVKTAAKSFKLGAKAKGKITCSKTSGSAALSVSKSGKVTVKKGSPLGIYTMSVTVFAKEYGHFNKAYRTVSVQVKVS